ncbi:MAG TPA: hypothetical protein VEZ11_02160, partial [Thermoanaerobaculia bacterium]|nr:hypothetical protein [Thermoanaerobaculia bacterium]
RVTGDATSVGTFATTQGGSVTIASDGTFKYTPPVTVSALSSDSFTYTGSSNTGTVPSIVQYAASTGPATATGTVTLNLANRVWYVRNSAGAGNGQSQSPFNTLSQAATSSTPNDIIFVYRGDGTSNFQNAGITLQSGQSLIGEGVALVVNGNPLVAAGVAPSIANTGGNVVTLASPAGNNTVEGLSISASSGHGIQANTLTGGINTISNVTIAATGANNGVNLINNSGSTFNVTGGLIVTSATGTGFNATGGGTVSATTTAGANTLSAAGGPAMNVVNTTIGASGLTFQSISANGGVNGIVLNNTGGLGGLTVAGDGSATRNNSGGTIQNMTGDGVVLTSTTSPSFSHMSIQNTVHNGVKGVLVTNLVFNHGSISNSGVSAGGAAVGSANDSNLSFGFPGAPLGTEQNLTGTVSIVDNALTNALYHGIDLRQFNGTVAYANISGNTLTSTTSAVTSIGTAINIGLNGGAGFASSLTKADITGNNINNFPSGSGMQLFGGNTNGTTPSNLGIQGDATNIVTITGNTLQGQSAVAQFGTTGVDFEVHGAGGGNGNINGNSISFVRGAGVIVDVGRGSATVTGSVSNNVLNTSNVLSSPGISIGLSNLVGSENASAPQLTLDVLGNTITNNNGIGILANSLRNAGTMKVKIQNNSVAAPTAAGNRAGIEVRSGGPAASTPGNTSVCTNIALNTVAGSGTFPGIGLRLQNLATATIAFGIDGLTGGGGSPATEQYVGNGVGGKNPGSANGILGTNGVLLESATTGFTACSLP